LISWLKEIETFLFKDLPFATSWLERTYFTSMQVMENYKSTHHKNAVNCVQWLLGSSSKVFSKKTMNHVSFSALQLLWLCKMFYLTLQWWTIMDFWQGKYNREDNLYFQGTDYISNHDMVAPSCSNSHG
jgi:hypothetical protein